MSEIESLIDVIAEKVAERVVDKLRANDMPGWVDQAASPLGRRRHIGAIRTGKLPGLHVGKRWLARTADVEALIAGKPRESDPSGPAIVKPRKKSLDEVASELGVEILPAAM